MDSMVTEGQQAPDFELADQNGQTHRLSDYLGQWVVVYFYPKDDTPGCTTEACNFRDNFETFNRVQAKVLGISTDTVKSHAKFADKYNLQFSLLADPDKQVVNQYGVWGEKKFMGKAFMGTNRTTFLIDPQGKVAKVYEQVKPEGHALQVQRDVAAKQTG